MAGKIPPHFIDDLLDRVDIVDVINTRVQLKKTGKNYSACCPFHEEKTPSFTVSPDKQFYYCFGCKATGNAIGFVMDYDRFSFPEAIEQLARDAGLEVPREETTPFEDERARHKKRLYETLDKADRFYRLQLRKHPAASHAVNYLKERGLSGQIAAAFGVGFSPPGWDNLFSELGDDLAAVRLQVETGLLIEKPEENKRYDRFRNRIMFPIRDTRGRTIAFGGRVLGDDKPKYLNSPETQVFHKGRELYGLYEASQRPGELTHALVVEGYMDVVALAQFGIDNAVATLGTSISTAHLEKLFRYTPQVVFCFDGDFAGTQAAHRALENALPLMTDGRSAKFLFLPDGEDPDTLVRQIGAEHFCDKVKQAEPLSQYLFKMLSEGLDTDTPDGKARLSKLAAPYLNSIPAGVFRELMISQLATITGLDTNKLDALISDGGRLTPSQPETVAEQIADTLPPATAPPEEAPPAYDAEHQWQPPSQPPNTGYNARKMQLTPERTAIAILLNNPQLALQVESPEELATLDTAEIKLLLGLIGYLKQQPDASCHQLLGHWLGIHRDDQGPMLAEIAACDSMYPPKEAVRDNPAEFGDALNLLRRQAFQAMPVDRQVAVLLRKPHLDEQDFKTVMRILPLALASDLPEEEKTKLKQILKKAKRG